VRALAALLLALAVPALAGCGASAETGQAPALELTGRGVDAAGILDDAAEVSLTRQLAALESEVGPQMVVVTTPDLKGREIEDYSLTLANQWGVGDKERNDGLLLVIAPTERKVRIELGRGLEGVLGDELCASIIVNDIVPDFKAGDFERGIADGVARLDYEMRAKLQKRAAA
jgi:uncharacterized protein